MASATVAAIAASGIVRRAAPSGSWITHAANALDPGQSVSAVVVGAVRMIPITPEP